MNDTLQRAISFGCSNTIGIARTLLAFGTFVTLMFNDLEMLLYPLSRTDTIDLYRSSPFIKDINLFNLLDANLGAARALCLVILLVVMAGWRPRFTCLLHWWVTWSFATKAVVQDGGDQVAQVLTLLLIPICLADSRKWHWHALVQPAALRQKLASIVAWSTLAVIKLQVALIYFEAATAKFIVEEWANGTSMFYWIQNPTFGIGNDFRQFAFELFANPFAVAFATWGTIVFELILFMAIMMKPKQQKILLLLGIGFHFGIVLLFGLVSFFFSMAAALVIYLGPKEGFEFGKIKKFIAPAMNQFSAWVLKKNTLNPIDLQ
ncbi:MAG: hypothetical protein IPN76_28035 [Saprospiraceae bacterium]|nr:hypothetical protein [Saprospiraceae bacterium]